MFNISNINFTNGVYDLNGRINGAEVMIMESSAKADNVIRDFEQALSAGMDPNQVIDEVLKNRHYSESDFTDMDINRINRKVEAIYKSVNNERRK